MFRRIPVSKVLRRVRRIVRRPPVEPGAVWVRPGHFYSPIPAVADVRAREHSLFAPRIDVPAVSLRLNEQRALLNEFSQWVGDVHFPVSPTPGHRFHFDNPAYSYTDATILQLMMRYFRPQRVIEVGSGYSSAAMLDTADRFLDGTTFTFIEPYPRILYQLIGTEGAGRTIRQCPVQDVEPEVFETLESGDILFIDSTHVSKVGSDVNYLMFEILPRLNAGVVIHIHDIFPGFEYPKEWIYEGRSWNEAYVLRAFLMYNSAFEIVFFNPIAVDRFADWFESNSPLCLRNPGGSIWLRKTGE